MIKKLDSYRVLTEESLFITVPGSLELMQTILRMHYDPSTNQAITSHLKLQPNKENGKETLLFMSAKTIQDGPNLLVFLQGEKKLKVRMLKNVLMETQVVDIGVS